MDSKGNLYREYSEECNKMINVETQQVKNIDKLKNLYILTEEQFELLRNMGRSDRRLWLRNNKFLKKY